MKLIKMKKGMFLSLNDIELASTDIDFIQNVLNAYPLAGFKLKNIRFNSQTWEHYCEFLATWPCRDKIEYVTLQACQLTPKRLSQFIDSVLPKLVNLHYLNLNDNQLDYNSAQQLMVAIRSLKLRHLMLRNNHIEVSVAEQLKSLNESIRFDSVLKQVDFTTNYIVSKSDKRLRQILEYLLVESRLTLKDFIRCKWKALEKTHERFELCLRYSKEEIRIPINGYQHRVLQELHKFHESQCVEMRDLLVFLQQSVKELLTYQPESGNKCLASLAKSEAHMLSKQILWYREDALLKQRLYRHSIFHTTRINKMQSRWVPEQMVTTDKWIAYILAYRGNIKNIVRGGAIEEHALLAFEGLHKNGQRIHKVAHLVFEKTNHLLGSSEIKIRYKPWQEMIMSKYHLAHYANVPRAKIKLLWHAIEVDMKNGVPREYKKFIPSVSVVNSKRHRELLQTNCLLWIINKFRAHLNIEIENQLGIPSHTVIAAKAASNNYNDVKGKEKVHVSPTSTSTTEENEKTCLVM